MKIYYSTYSFAFDPPHGGERQMMDLMSGIRKQGMHAVSYDPWEPRLDEADIFHYFSVQPGSEEFFAHIKQRGIPLVVTPNTWIADKINDKADLRRIHRCLNCADKVILNSESEKTNYGETFPDLIAKFTHVKCAVPDEFYIKPKKDFVFGALKIPKNFVLVVGEFGPGKYYKELITALKAMPHISLVVIGEVVDDKYVFECMNDAGSQLFYVGTLPRNSEILRSAMRESLAVIIPSINDSPSIVAIEALAQGATVMIGDGAVSREYFGDLVRYVNPLDTDSIVSALGELQILNINSINKDTSIVSKNEYQQQIDSHLILYKSLIGK